MHDPHGSPPHDAHPGHAPSQPGWPASPPRPHEPAAPALHQNASAVHATGLGGATGQAYLAMFTRRPVPHARLVGLGMLGVAAMAGLIQSLMIGLGGVYSWEGMLALFGSGLPGLYFAVLGDEPDPETGLVPPARRAGLIACFVVAVVLAMAASGFLVWVVGVEHW